MKKINLKTANIDYMFQRLNQNLGGSLETENNEHFLVLDNDLGRGTMKGISFNSGISYLEFDMVFSEDCQLIVQNYQNRAIHFAYCSEGSFSHSLGLEGEKRAIELFQTGILAAKSPENHSLWFKKNVQLKVSLISVNTVVGDSYNAETLHGELRKTFMSGKDDFVYIGSHNLKIVEKIQQLDAITQKGLVRRLLIEGLVHMILALEIQQHSDDMKNRENDAGSLTHKEMCRVQELSCFIGNYPERELSIKYLSAKSALSPCKLQEGFKLMHNRTVADYIREVRVKRAEELIKNTDLNISEVVYSIGFTSRSYFSKIFKQKYNCSPKEYKENQHSLAVTA